MNKLFLPLILFISSLGVISCSENGGLSKIGGGEAASTVTRNYFVSAPVEVVVGEPYAISLIDSTGRIATGLTRLVITRESTQLVDTQQQDLALYSHTADAASVGKILNYIMYYNGNQYFSGSLVIAPEPEE